MDDINVYTQITYGQNCTVQLWMTHKHQIIYDQICELQLHVWIILMCAQRLLCAQRSVMCNYG
jgi:hypothetical protein